MSNTRSIHVEGWRQIPHSYAIASSFEMLELLKRPGIRLTHQDIPYVNPSWTPVTGLFDPADESAIRALPGLQSGETPDVVYRITFPYNFAPSRGKRTYVFGTSEYRCVPSSFVAGSISLTAAMAQSDAAVITSSEWSRDGYIESGADPSRVFNVGLGFDPKIFHPVDPDRRADLREKMGAKTFTFFSSGAMTANKGVNMLLKAFANVAMKRPHVQLMLKGMGALYNSRAMLEAQAGVLTTQEASFIEPRIHFIDSTVSFAEMAKVYQALDAYVSPYFAEGFNMPVLEAAACGMPVICTKGGSTDDFTRPEFALQIPSKRFPFSYADGITGTRLEPDFDQLIEHMLRVVDDPSFAAQAYRAGPEFALSAFTWKHVVDRLLAIMFPQT